MNTPDQTQPERTMTPRISALCLALALTGCANSMFTPSTFVHPTKGAAQFEQDKLECTYETDKAFGGSPSSLARMSQYVDQVKMCLQVRGWRQQ